MVSDKIFPCFPHISLCKTCDPWGMAFLAPGRYKCNLNKLGRSRNIEKALEISTNVIVLGDLNEDLFNPNVHGLKDVMIL